jgi:hypothetical protein
MSDYCPLCDGPCGWPTQDDGKQERVDLVAPQGGAGNTSPGLAQPSTAKPHGRT